MDLDIELPEKQVEFPTVAVNTKTPLAVLVTVAWLPTDDKVAMDVLEIDHTILAPAGAPFNV